MILPTDSVLFKTEAEIIKHIAKERPAVIIGRCGSFILKENPNHVSIFLHSDMTFRKKRIQKLFNVTEKVAKKLTVQSDKERSLYYHNFTGNEWTDATQFDLSINTGKIGLGNSIDFIMKYLELKQKNNRDSV
jgi:cytidylate kinase